MSALTAPYAGLSPDLVLGAVESLGLITDGRLLALNSYENRVYQVGIEDAAPLIAKFYRPGRWSDAAILEEHAFARELNEAELPVVAPLVFSGRTLIAFANFRFALFPRRGGRAPELESQENLARVGRLLARIHGIGARCAFRERDRLDIETMVRKSAQQVLHSALLPEALRDRYQQRIDALDRLLTAHFLAVDGLVTLRLHGDCHIGNVLWTDTGPHLVDLDDARMGPAVQDLWMLAPNQRAMDALLEGYCEFRDFDYRELKLIEPLRVMRQIHYAGWLAARWSDPAFPRSFPWAGEARWWEQQLQDLAEAEQLLEEALSS